MAYSLEELRTDIRVALQADPGVAGQRKVCDCVSNALIDADFVAQHLTSDQCQPRKVLYKNPELGFCICGHVDEKAIDTA